MAKLGCICHKLRFKTMGKLIDHYEKIIGDKMKDEEERIIDDIVKPKSKRICWNCNVNYAICHLSGEYATGAFGIIVCKTCLNNYLTKDSTNNILRSNLYKDIEKYKVSIRVVE